MNNLHISLTEFRNESRVLKETGSIVKYGIASYVFVAALHGNGLDENANISSNIFLKRFKLYSRRLPKNLIVQVFKYIEFLIRVAIYYKNIQIDMVNIHGIGLLPLGVLLKYWYGAKLIYDTHELETETNGLYGLRKKLAKWVERNLIRFADQIFVVSESIADQYAADYQIDRPVVVLNAPIYKAVKKTNRLRDALNIADDATIFLYQGALTVGRGIKILLESFKRLNNPQAVVVFMGYGPLEQMIKSDAEKYGNIYFHPAIPPDDVLNYTASADLGIHLIRNTCLNHYYCMPNKLFEYTMAGLPCIVSNMKEMAAFVTNYNIGVVAENESPEAIILAIELLLRDIKQLSKNTKKASKQHSWISQEKKMISVYKKLFNKAVI